MTSHTLFMLTVGFCLCYAANAYDGPVYDSYASIECKAYPEVALYNGGMLRDHARNIQLARGRDSGDTYSPGFLLHDLFRGFYTFSMVCVLPFSGMMSRDQHKPSAWVMLTDADPSLIRASLTAEGTKYDCIGTVVARQRCWSFLKGGFVLESPSNLSVIYFQNGDARDLQISLASPSLQGFTEEQWRLNQHYHINRERKRVVTIHTSDLNGGRLQGAVINIQQMSREFPFGSAIASTIIDNQPYQEWFRERFNAAVFENELKWYATEPEHGNISYRVADQMLEFIRANQIVARGHNIFWEDPKYTPSWVLNLTATELQEAVASRIQSLMSRYRGEFVHWDVSNEMLHFDFYEQRLGSSATLSFFEAAHDADPLSTLFMNEFNVVETCADPDSTVDSYISRLLELKQGGISMDGIGLEGHFSIPNPPLMRAILDKLGTLELPIWLTEVDISNQHDNQAQAVYLEEVLREGFSHTAVKGIMLWSAFHPQPRGCYQMCLTDDNFQNLPAGDVVDRLLVEWQTGTLQGVSDDLGLFAFSGFLGEYRITVRYGNRSAEATLSLSRGEETKHFNIQL